jgi:hypothetical protein
MPPTLPAIPGLRIRGTGHARPSDVAPDRVPGRLTNAQAYERLLGPDWRSELARRGLNWARPRNAWGITAREWACVPGPGAEPGCTLVELAAAAGRRALEAAGWSTDDVPRVGLITNGLPLALPTEAGGAADGAAAHREQAHREQALRDGLGAALGLTLSTHRLDLYPGVAGGLYGWVAALLANHADPRAEGAPLRDRPECDRMLLIGADLLSPALDPADLAAALVHGDAAAAVAIEVTDEPGGGLDGAGLGSTPDAEGAAAALTHDDEGRPRLARPTPPAVARARAAWEQAIGGIANLPSAAVFMPFGVTRGQIEEAAEFAHYSPARTKASITEHGCTGAAAIFLSLHDFLVDSDRAGADLNVVNVDLVGAGTDGRWAWLRWNLGDGTEPEAAHVPTD